MIEPVRIYYLKEQHSVIITNNTIVMLGNENLFLPTRRHCLINPQIKRFRQQRLYCAVPCVTWNLNYFKAELIQDSRVNIKYS